MALLLCLSALGCSRGDVPPRDRGDAAPPIDPTLLAFLSRARAAHHAADVHEANKRQQAALSVLQDLLDGPHPDKERFTEVREVLADTLARTAELRSREQLFSEGLSDVDRGLSLVKKPDYFRGHLLEVRGVIEQRHAKQLTKDGRMHDAELAEKRAISAFEESMRIQAKVIDESVSGSEDQKP